jgi:hypothetical protein
MYFKAQSTSPKSGTQLQLALPPQTIRGNYQRKEQNVLRNRTQKHKGLSVNPKRRRRN